MLSVLLYTYISIYIFVMKGLIHVLLCTAAGPQYNLTLSLPVCAQSTSGVIFQFSTSIFALEKDFGEIKALCPPEPPDD
jgi:hypothetical protein